MRYAVITLSNYTESDPCTELETDDYGDAYNYASNYPDETRLYQWDTTRGWIPADSDD